MGVFAFGVCDCSSLAHGRVNAITVACNVTNKAASNHRRCSPGSCRSNHVGPCAFRKKWGKVIFGRLASSSSSRSLVRSSSHSFWYIFFICSTQKIGIVTSNPF